MTEVIDVGINRVEVSERRSEGSQTESDEADTEKGQELVGDVEFESARKKASAITLVPGGVGPRQVSCRSDNSCNACTQPRS